MRSLPPTGLNIEKKAAGGGVKEQIGNALARVTVPILRPWVEGDLVSRKLSAHEEMQGFYLPPFEGFTF